MCFSLIKKNYRKKNVAFYIIMIICLLLIFRRFVTTFLTSITQPPFQYELKFLFLTLFPGRESCQFFKSRFPGNREKDEHTAELSLCWNAPRFSGQNKGRLHPEPSRKQRYDADHETENLNTGFFQGRGKGTLHVREIFVGFH